MDDYDLTRLRTFVRDIGGLIDEGHADLDLVQSATPLLAALVAADDWLPPPFAVPDPERYRQNLLHCDSRERFCVVSFVWGPGQSTPVHDHTVWGLVGVLRGSELSQKYQRRGAAVDPLGEPRRLMAGDVEAFTPETGDIHRVSNGEAKQPSVSIHVYGANIGAVRRSTFDDNGAAKTFVSGFSNALLPNIWRAARRPANEA